MHPHDDRYPGGSVLADPGDGQNDEPGSDRGCFGGHDEPELA